MIVRLRGEFRCVAPDLPGFGLSPAPPGSRSMLANKQGLDRTDIVKLHYGLPLSLNRLEALRLFTESVVDTRGKVTDGTIGEFTQAGFTKAQILDVILGIAIKTLTNYANHISQPPVNVEFAGFLPNWAH